MLRYDVCDKNKIFLNQLSNLVINKNKILEDFILIEVRASSKETKFLALYDLLDNKDFYKDRLLAVNNYGFTTHLLFYKDGSDVLKKLKSDVDGVLIKRLNNIEDNLTTTILNLFLKAILKEKLKDKVFNTAYKYIIPIDFMDDMINIRALIFNFSTDSVGGNRNYYLNYSVRNLKRFDAVNKNEKEKDYDVFRLVNADYNDINNYYFEASFLSDKSYVVKARRSDSKVKLLNQILLYANNNSLLESFYNTIMMRFMSVYNDFLKYFKDYISFEFLSLKSNEYEKFEYTYKKNYGRIANEKFLKILEEKIEDKSIEIIDNLGVSDTYIKDLEDIFKEIGIKVSNKGDYVLNIVEDPLLLEGKLDYYKEHDFKKTFKNFIYDRAYDKDMSLERHKMLKSSLKAKVKIALFSLIIEDELIERKTKFLDYDDINFIFYKKYKDNKKLGFIYRLYVNEGNLDFSYIDGDHIKSDDSLYYLKDFLDLTYDNEEAGNYGDNKVRDYNIDMYVIKGEFNNIYDLMILRKTFLKPIINPDIYEDLFVNDNIFDGSDTFYPKLAESSKHKYLSLKSKNIIDYQYAGFMDIKLIDNVYISGYKNNDELFFEYLSPADRFNTMPLALRYIKVLRHVVRGDREVLEDEKDVEEE